MDSSYVAMAANNKTFKQMLVVRSMDIESTAVFITCPIAIIIIFTFVILPTIMMLHCFFRDTFQKGGLNRHRKAAIVSSAVIGFNRLVYFIALDICAITFKEFEYPKYYSFDGLPADELHAVLYNIPWFLFAFDALFLILSLLCIVVSLVGLCICRISSKHTCMSENTQCVGKPEPADNGGGKVLQDKVYYFLLPVTVFFLLGILLHMPYIAMAYLSDPRHAASILIYYIVITFSEFGLLELTFRSIWFGKDKKLSNGVRCALGTGIAVLLSLSVYILTVAATMFFYLIPVSESIGRAPSQVVITYQTAFILVGGYIIYRVIIKKQNSFQRAIRNSECAEAKDWKTKPDHELLTYFYKYIIDKMDKFLDSRVGSQQTPAAAVINKKKKKQKKTNDDMALAGTMSPAATTRTNRLHDKK